MLRLAVDRFHVLFNPLFRVLFDFPSRYLSAIGLVGRYLALDGVYHPRLSQKREIVFRLHSQAVRLDRGRCVPSQKTATKRVEIETEKYGKKIKPKKTVCFEYTTGLPPSTGLRSRGLGLDSNSYAFGIKEPSCFTPHCIRFPCEDTFNDASASGFFSRFHSQLLARSRLVSFPPPIDMLKFSGCSRLTRGVIRFSIRVRFRSAARAQNARRRFRFLL